MMTESSRFYFDATVDLNAAAPTLARVAPEELKHFTPVLFEMFNRHLWQVWDGAVRATRGAEKVEGGARGAATTSARDGEWASVKPECGGCFVKESLKKWKKTTKPHATPITKN